jgi:superfamily II DNA or RNA helicase
LPAISFHIDPITTSTLLTIVVKGIPAATGYERDALKLLEQEERQQPAATRKPQSYRIPHGRFFPILKLLAATGNLHLGANRITIDLFGKVNSSYRIESVEGNMFAISCQCEAHGESFPLSQCDFVGAGSPIWFVRKGMLKLIQQDISWKIVGDPKRRFTKDEVLQLMDDLQADQEQEDAPQCLMDATTQNMLQAKREPFPRLVLRERTGAFASLMMDYGDGALVPFDNNAQGRFKDGKGIVIQRLLEQERAWEKDLLETDYIQKTTDNANYYCPVDRVVKSLTFLLECGWTIIDSKGNRILRHLDQQMALEDGASHVLVKGRICYENHQVDLQDVVGAFNRRERFVQLSTNTVGLLPDLRENNLIAGLMEQGELVSDGIRVSRSRVLTLDAVWNQQQLAIDDSLQDLSDKLRDFQGISCSAPGSGFRGSLRPYQQQGVNWLAFLYDHGFHGLLADDMGLGKTVQVLAFLSRLMPVHRPILIVVPTTLMFNWKQEVARFLGMDVIMHHGPDRADSIDVLQQASVIITSYTTLRIDLPLLSQIQYECLILDEAQAIKNAHTQTFQAVIRLQSRFRLSITGTPIENRLEELWAHYRFLMPKLLGDESKFAADASASQVDSRYLQRIRTSIRPFFLRRRKEEVAQDLPPKIEQVVWVEMDDTQRGHYEHFLQGARNGLLQKVQTDGMGKHRMEVLETLLRLRQICCDPLLVGGEGISSAKLETLFQDLETVRAEGSKVLVYSQFTTMLQLMAKKASERGWTFVTLDGSTKDREAVVNTFQNDSSIQLFLISLKAGGSGLNLTAADYVFLYDPWWNEAVEQQAIDRAHRIGRMGSVVAKRYVIAESIEEKMMQLKASKRSLVDSLIDEAPFEGSLTLDDFEFLLS